MLLPLPAKMWEATDRVEIFRLLQSCGVNFAKALVACARVRKVKWDDPQCIGWLSYDFELGKVLVILVRERLGEKRDRGGDRRVVAEVEVFSVYVDGYRDEGTSLRFAEVAYKRYLTLGTDLRGFPSLVA